MDSLLGGVIGALVGALAAWILGAFTKLIEFRFDLWRRASEAYTTAEKAANVYLAEKSELIHLGPDPKKPGEAAYEDLAQALTDVTMSAHDMMSLTPMIHILFAQGADQWQQIIYALHKLDEPDEVTAANMVLAMHDEWWKFTRIAERKCMLNPFRRWTPKVFDWLTAGKWRGESDGGGK